MSKSRKRMTVRVIPDGMPITIIGRDAWALDCLLGAGERGCTPIDNPGPRWSHYVFKLRQAGLVVETVHENHGGPYPGTHARYVLRSKVEIISESESEAA